MPKNLNKFANFLVVLMIASAFLSGIRFDFMTGHFNISQLLVFPMVLYFVFLKLFSYKTLNNNIKYWDIFSITVLFYFLTNLISSLIASYTLRGAS